MCHFTLDFSFRQYLLVFITVLGTYEGSIYLSIYFILLFDNEIKCNALACVYVRLGNQVCF